MRVVRIAAVVGILSALTVGLSACADDPANGVKGQPPEDNKQFTVYVSLPLRGPDSAQSHRLINGMRLALAERKGEIDGNRIRWVVLDDTSADGKWDDGEVLDNARSAIRDRTTVAYIGELDSGASALSIPILNEAGVLQVSPTSGYSGLTRKGVVQGEPDKYYPSGRRTFGRVTPSDYVQAQTQVKYQQAQGCQSVFLLNDEDAYGTGLSRDIETLLESEGLTLAGTEIFNRDALDYADVAKTVVAETPDCVFFGGDDVESAVRMWRALHHADPSIRIFGPDALVTTDFTARTGAAAGSTFLTSPQLERSDYPPQAAQVLRRYRQRYDEVPDLNALYGYATMDAVLNAVAQAKGGASRQRGTIESFFDLDQESVLGRFSIDDNGDSSLSSYGTYTVSAGKPVFDAAIDTAG